MWLVILVQKVLGDGREKKYFSRGSRTRGGSRKKRDSKNELLTLAEAHLAFPQKNGFSSFPRSGAVEEQAHGS